MEYFLDGLKHAFVLLITLDPETFSAISVSLRVSALSLFFSLLIGLPIGFFIGFYNFRGKKIVRNILNSLLSLPTVVVGLLCYILINSKGPLGDFDLLFTIKGMAFGQFILATPIIVTLTASAIEAMDSRLSEELSSLGASKYQIPFTYLYEAKGNVFTAAVTGFGRVFGEVGLSMMIGGNIKWHTRTMTTAIALETGKGEFALALALGIVLMSISLFINFLSNYIAEKF